MASWIWGVVISVVGVTILNLGLQLKRLSFRRDLAKPVDQRRMPCCQPIWCLGMTFFLLGNLADFVALGLTAQSVIAPLGSISLVTNALLAPLINKEIFKRTDLLATVTIISGALLVVIFGSHTEKEYTLNTLLKLYQRPAFIAYACFVGILITTVLCIIFVLRRRMKERAAASITPRERKMLATSYAAAGGLIGSITILVAKSSSELFEQSLAGDNQFVHFFTYVIVALMVISGVSQVYWINVGIREFDNLYIVPIFYVIWTTAGIAGGSVYFDEFDSFHTINWIMFPVGVLVNFAGVYLIAKRDTSQGLPASGDHDQVGLMLDPQEDGDGFNQFTIDDEDGL